ncbi:multiple sugar transport system substrate-binding protein [Sulfitobacter undariae]|uniref:Multiple sugar transport system substrate-binding protein n=1 Tax=Sulfitobacter undariae TaxID=1563671 RepID=A0A7W6H1V3_9RHOB|nr:extracellular solute-binding protein [Sulfitobacter undariae]MBB3995945.1 multiple sugar transport system substrate-binding protein [Sulfitobacter undariae]
MNNSSLSRRGFTQGAAMFGAAAALPVHAFAQEDAVVTISSPWGADRPFQKVVDAYNAKQTGVSVVNRLDGSYEDMATKALASVAAGRPPEIMVTGWKFGYFARRTLAARDFYDIDSTKADAIMGNFKPSMKPLVTIDGALIGLPWSLSTPVTWINMDLWREAGLDDNIPLDISHEWLVAQAAKLDKALGNKKHPTYRSAIDLSNNEWTSQAYIQNAGGFILDGTNLTCDSAEAIAGITAFAEPAKMGLWTNMDYRAQAKAQYAGNIAIVTTSSSRAGPLSALDTEFKDVMFPSMDGKRNMNSGGNFLSIYTQNDELAKASMDFLAFCATQEAQAIWSEMGYANVSKFDLGVKPLQTAAVAQLDAGLTAETIWPGERGLEGQSVWRQWVARITEGVVTPEEGLARAKRELAPLVSA